MLRYFISDRHQAGGMEALLAQVTQALAQGIEMLQVREKDLSARELWQLAERVRHLPNPHGTRLILNSRLDIALALGFHGVHLPSRAPAPRQLRPICPQEFVIGVSCHSAAEVRQASDEGADFVVYSPVFETPGKGPPVGLPGLHAAVAAASVPVFALGGVTRQNAPECIAAGAVGVAGIRLFLET